MRIAIYIADLNSHNKHLMPWRTVLEILRELQIAGHTTLLLCGRSKIKKSSPSKFFLGIELIEVLKPFSSKNRKLLSFVLKKRQIEKLYFPIAFARDYSPLGELEILSGCRLVWFVPGGWVSTEQIFKAVLHIGIKPSLPFFVQALMPKRYFIRKLKSIGDRAILTMTEYTAEKLRFFGYRADFVFPALPGKAPVKKEHEKPCVYPYLAKQLYGIKYFLFFGPPNPIRGIKQILRAFSEIANYRPDFKLVFLFRGDRNVDQSKTLKQINSASFGDRIISSWSSLNGADIDLFIKNCFAVLKPFLIVPSEIPLAVLETAGYGKPVIVTGPDGTGEFIDKFGLTVPYGNSKALGNAMLKLLDDNKLYELKCRKANELYEKHSDWCTATKIWLRAGEI